MQDGIIAADKLHRSRMEHGSIMLRRAIYQARTGKECATEAELIWLDAYRSPNWVASEDSATSEYGRHLMARLIARDKRADEQRTFRDPCPLCAVRADIGCRHRRVA